MLRDVPLVLGHYARDEGVITLEQAVRKKTTMPAERIGPRGRGQIRQGWFGDVVVFDAETVIDRATSRSRINGIAWVLLNGQITVEDGEFRDVRADAVLRRGRDQEDVTSARRALLPSSPECALGFAAAFAGQP